MNKPPTKAPALPTDHPSSLPAGRNTAFED